VQEQLLGFINEEIILEPGKHHVAKFVIGQESAPPPSPPKRRNPAKKNQRASDSSLLTIVYISSGSCYKPLLISIIRIAADNLRLSAVAH
jgi:hypothetical protein